MAKHNIIKQRKTRRLQQVFKVVRNSNNKVKLNDLYDYLGTEWNTSAYFIQDVLKNAPDDITINAMKKVGTFAVKTGHPCLTIKQVTMGGLFPKTYEGTYIHENINLDVWTEIKKLPKMFSQFANETIALFRFDSIGKPSQYLQITNQGKWLFNQV